MNVKVRIVKPMLRPMGHDEALQRIAIVYVDREEYRVLAPAGAEGPAIEWLDQALVRQPDTSTFGAELEADSSVAEFVIKCVREELEKVALTTAGPPPAEVAEDSDFAFDAIQLLCTRFHEVIRQLRVRHASRNTLDVQDEYDVQDLMHALLRIFCDDVRDEEWSPSYAGGASRMDFLLPDIETVLETKKTRHGLGAREIGEQLIIDVVKYKEHPKCKHLVCLVYDPEGRVANPRGLEKDLSKKHGELDVKVFVVPR